MDRIAPEKSSKTRPTMRVVLCLLLCCVATAIPRFARAADATQCSEAILKSLGDYVGAAHIVRPGAGGKTPGLVVQDACMLWPADPKITLAVAAYTDEPQKETDEVEAWNIVVAMVDTETAGVVAAYKGEGGEADAATHFGGYSLDTAVYTLAPGVQAFGVIDNTGMHGPDCADGGSGASLTLWVRDKVKLRPVFSANLDEWTTREGSACVTSELGRIEQAHMTLGIGKARTNGFADLSLVAHVTATIWDADHQGDDIPVGTRRMSFKYDGKSYGDGPSDDWWVTNK